MKFGTSLGDAEWDFIQYTLAEAFGWTYDYIDSLDDATVRRILGVREGVAKARKKKR